jgi:hypothetical protein
MNWKAIATLPLAAAVMFSTQASTAATGKITNGASTSSDVESQVDFYLSHPGASVGFDAEIIMAIRDLRSNGRFGSVLIDSACSTGEVCCLYDHDRSPSCMSRHDCLDTWNGKILDDGKCK